MSEYVSEQALVLNMTWYLTSFSTLIYKSMVNNHQTSVKQCTHRVFTKLTQISNLCPDPPKMLGVPERLGFPSFREAAQVTKVALKDGVQAQGMVCGLVSDERDEEKRR
jgi:hypothetical protein